jgi:hypothetical protein
LAGELTQPLRTSLSAPRGVLPGLAPVNVEFHGPPSREESRCTWTTTKLATTRAGLEQEEAPREEMSVIAPDPPEFCDAYDAWMQEYRVIRRQLEEVWSSYSVQA